MDLSKIVHNYTNYYYCNVNERLYLSRIVKPGHIVAELRVMNSFQTKYSINSYNEQLTQKITLNNHKNILFEKLIPYTVSCYYDGLNIEFTSNVPQILKIQAKIVVIQKEYYTLLEKQACSFFDPKYNIIFEKDQNNNYRIYSSNEIMSVDDTVSYFGNLSIFRGTQVLTEPQFSNDFDIINNIYHYNFFNLEFIQDYPNELCLSFILTRHFDIIERVLIQTKFNIKRVKFEIGDTDCNNLKIAMTSFSVLLEFEDLLTIFHNHPLKLLLFIEKTHCMFEPINCYFLAGFMKENLRKQIGYPEKQIIFLKEVFQKN
jgi:hypothetical protein